MKQHSFKDWVLATRPWSFPASSMPVVVTIAWTWAQGINVNWWFALWALINIIFVHAAGNVWSDIADYRKGVDAEDTFGVHTLVDKLFTVDEYRRLSLILNAIAIIGGLALVALTGWPLLVIGAIGIALSFLYPRLKYMALGDLVIALCYAFLPMTGTSFIVSGSIHWNVLWLAVPVGLITVAILHANNVRDIETDSRAGISTVPMFTGRSVGAKLYAFEVLFPFLWLFGLMAFHIEPWWLLIAFAALPVAFGNAHTILDYEQGGKESYANLDERTAKLQLLFSLLLTIALVISKFF